MSLDDLVKELTEHIQRADKSATEYSQHNWHDNASFYAGLSTGLDIARAMLKALILKGSTHDQHAAPSLL